MSEKVEYLCDKCGLVTENPRWSIEPVYDRYGEIVDEMDVSYCPDCGGMMWLVLGEWVE